MVAALKPFDSRDAEKIIIILHSGRQRHTRVPDKQISCHAYAGSGSDVIHHSPDCLLLQTGIRIHCQKKWGMDLRQTTVERIGFSQLRAIEIFHLPLFPGQPLHFQHLFPGAVFRSIVNHQKPNHPLVVLLQNSADCLRNRCFFIVRT